MVPVVMAVLVLWEWEKPGVKVEDIEILMLYLVHFLLNKYFLKIG